MPTNYLMVNGMKIGHVKDGVRTDYLTDALGSVTATKNQSQQIVNTYRYKPYGKLLAKTGSGDDPRYLWTGNTGSRVTQTRNVNQYNVARHYANSPAVWTSVDPLWPEEWAYRYVYNRPTMELDPLGEKPETPSQRLKKCKGLSPGACFRCMYPILIDPMGFTPLLACRKAKEICGSTIACGPCGPYSFPEPPPAHCDVRSQWNFAWNIHDNCGGVTGNDKLAHCYFNCVMAQCSGLPLCMLTDLYEEDPEDSDANKIGRGIAAGIPHPSAAECLSRCAEATAGMSVDLDAAKRRLAKKKLQ